MYRKSSVRVIETSLNFDLKKISCVSRRYVSLCFSGFLEEERVEQHDEERVGSQREVEAQHESHLLVQQRDGCPVQLLRVLPLTRSVVRSSQQTRQPVTEHHSRSHAL